MKLQSITLATLLFTAGCASVTNGPDQDVHIASTPPGAILHVDGKEEGVTPMVVHLSRRDNHKFTIERSGYISNTGTLESHFRFGKWFFGNLFSLPVIGHVIDSATGSANNLTPVDVSVQLSKKDEG